MPGATWTRFVRSTSIRRPGPKCSPLPDEPVHRIRLEIEASRDLTHGEVVYLDPVESGSRTDEPVGAVVTPLLDHWDGKELHVSTEDQLYFRQRHRVIVGEQCRCGEDRGFDVSRSHVAIVLHQPRRDDLRAIAVSPNDDLREAFPLLLRRDPRTVERPLSKQGVTLGSKS